LSNTKAVGIRIPVGLYDLVMSANPGKTFTDIVKSALAEKYGFNSAKELVENGISDIDRVHVEVDNFLHSSVPGD